MKVSVPVEYSVLAGRVVWIIEVAVSVSRKVLMYVDLKNSELVPGLTGAKLSNVSYAGKVV